MVTFFYNSHMWEGKKFKHLKTKVLTTVLARSYYYMLNDLIDIKPHSPNVNHCTLTNFDR